LGWIESANKPCVFIGKPCDVTGATKARQVRDTLHQKLGITLAIFCAGTPSVAGTIEVSQRMGVDDPNQITAVQYRGNGWPGEMEIGWTDPVTSEAKTNRLSYEEAWGDILQRHRQWRCRVCADHTGELADLSFGDPWYRPSEEGDPGRSLILVRTERGRRILREAMNAGYLELEKCEPWVLEASQPHLLQNQNNMWGRLLACRLVGMFVPRYQRMRLGRLWWKRLTWKNQLKSIVGTLRRVLGRKLRNAEQATVFDGRKRESSEPSGVANQVIGDHHCESTECSCH
jgi:coenzyme F420 hydrogenase subunit beta